MVATSGPLRPQLDKAFTQVVSDLGVVLLLSFGDHMLGRCEFKLLSVSQTQAEDLRRSRNFRSGEALYTTSRVHKQRVGRLKNLDHY